MATTAGCGSDVKRQKVEAGDEAQQVVRDQVEELARQGARQMLLAALEDEVNVYLARDRYQRQGEFRGYRNGTTPRRLTLGSGTVPLDVPRVRDIPAGQAPFESGILRKYQRRSDSSTRPSCGCSSKAWPRGTSNRPCGCWPGRTRRCRPVRSAD